LGIGKDEITLYIEGKAMSVFIDSNWFDQFYSPCMRREIGSMKLENSEN